jgi:hypothetical protein
VDETRALYQFASDLGVENFIRTRDDWLAREKKLEGQRTTLSSIAGTGLTLTCGDQSVEVDRGGFAQMCSVFADTESEGLAPEEWPIGSVALLELVQGREPVLDELGLPGLLDLLHEATFLGVESLQIRAELALLRGVRTGALRLRTLPRRGMPPETRELLESYVEAAAPPGWSARLRHLRRQIAEPKDIRGSGLSLGEVDASPALQRFVGGREPDLDGLDLTGLCALLHEAEELQMDALAYRAEIAILSGTLAGDLAPTELPETAMSPVIRQLLQAWIDLN